MLDLTDENIKKFNMAKEKMYRSWGYPRLNPITGEPYVYCDPPDACTTHGRCYVHSVDNSELETCTSEYSDTCLL